MKSRLHKRVNLRRKIHILKNIANSKAEKREFIIMDTVLRILKLKLKLESIKREYIRLIMKSQEVKVEKAGEYLTVNITCKKGQNMLVSILETFEDMGLNLVHARVSSTNCLLSIEAIVEAQDKSEIDVICFKQAVHKAINEKGLAC